MAVSHFFLRITTHWVLQLFPSIITMACVGVLCVMSSLWQIKFICNLQYLQCWCCVVRACILTDSQHSLFRDDNMYRCGPGHVNFLCTTPVTCYNITIIRTYEHVFVTSLAAHERQIAVPTILQGTYRICIEIITEQCDRTMRKWGDVREGARRRRRRELGGQEIQCSQGV